MVLEKQSAVVERVFARVKGNVVVAVKLDDAASDIWLVKAGFALVRK
jgi:hypothetical protein